MWQEAYSESQSFQVSTLWTRNHFKVGARMGKNQHVTPSPQGGWQVKGATNKRATSLHQTQEQARQAAVKIARNQESEVLVHNKQGVIRQKNSYGNDPFPPKG